MKVGDKVLIKATVDELKTYHNETEPMVGVMIKHCDGKREHFLMVPVKEIAEFYNDFIDYDEDTNDE